MPENQKKKVHYAWTVCIVSTLLIFVTMGTVSNGFSVYLPYIINRNSFTHAQGSFLVTLRCLVSFCAMLFIGYFYKLFSLRKGVGLAAFCAGLAFSFYSIAHTYLTFCIGAALSGVSYGLGSMIPVSILMNRWFVERKTLALGICASGSGIATIILPPVTAELIRRLSMEWAFLVEAVFIFAAAVVIVLLVRNSPEEKGLRPFGEKEEGEASATQATEIPVEESRTLSRKVWILMGCVSLCMGALANPGFSHLAVLFSTEGFDDMTVAYFISGVGVMITLGKLIYGQVTDKVGGYKSSILFGFILLFGHLLCCLAFYKSVSISVLTVLLLGMGYPIATIGPSVWAVDLASRDRFPTVVRRLQVVYAAGALAFASIPGILADRFGSYIPAYLLFSSLLIVTLLFIWLSYRGHNKG